MGLTYWMYKIKFWIPRMAFSLLHLLRGPHVLKGRLGSPVTSTVSPAGSSLTCSPSTQALSDWCHGEVVVEGESILLFP